MGLFQPKPYKAKQKDGTWKYVQPEPREYNHKKMIGVGRGSNHFNFDLVLLESKMQKP